MRPPDRCEVPPPHIRSEVAEEFCAARRCWYLVRGRAWPLHVAAAGSPRIANEAKRRAKARSEAPR